MSGFDKRERAEEGKFALDQELRFKANARRNKLLGLWAAEKLGKDGKPFIASMKRIQPNLESRTSKKDKQAATLQQAPPEELNHMVQLWRDVLIAV